MTPVHYSDPPLAFRLPHALPAHSVRRVGKRVTKRSKQEFANKLKAWRERCELSQSQAADRLNLSVRTLQNWEIARTAPTAVLREMLIKKFDA
jgi:DNA-binding transcriptional regulator YiaG